MFAFPGELVPSSTLDMNGDVHPQVELFPDEVGDIKEEIHNEIYKFFSHFDELIEGSEDICKLSGNLREGSSFFVSAWKK